MIQKPKLSSKEREAKNENLRAQRREELRSNSFNYHIFIRRKLSIKNIFDDVKDNIFTLITRNWSRTILNHLTSVSIFIFI